MGLEKPEAVYYYRRHLRSLEKWKLTGRDIHKEEADNYLKLAIDVSNRRN